ncbi:MAG: glycosyltransferase family protein [Geminicoccaceae bacterium]
MSPRCLIWVQSLLGSGHLRRAMLLADALAAHGAEVTLANGGPPGPWPASEGVRLAQLPPLVSRDSSFSALVDSAGDAVGEALWAERRRILLDLLAAEPHAIVTEMFPFGRRAFRVELLPLLERCAARSPRPVVAASVRDILVTKPDPARYRWMVETCLTHYDRVLVHGDDRLMPFAATFPAAPELGERVTHTGFVHVGEVAPAPAVPAAVVVSAGGGAVGERLLLAALDARPHTRFACDPWLLVGGHNLPLDRLTRLRSLLPAGCTLEQHRPDLASLMGRAVVSISQAGYNTVVEGLAGGARMVLVPFAAGVEDEQERRAQRLAALGLAERIGEAELDGMSLAVAIDRIGSQPRPDPTTFSFDGADRSARLILQWVRERFGEP